MDEEQKQKERIQKLVDRLHAQSFGIAPRERIEGMVMAALAYFSVDKKMCYAALGDLSLIKDILSNLGDN